MKDIKIKDVNLVTNVTGNEKIPVSNGSGKPAAVTINQILEKGKANQSEIPTKLSQLENDTNYVKDLDYKVYAVTANDQLIDYVNADKSCIGVAVITKDQKFMINKMDAQDGMMLFRWNSDTSELPLTKYSTINGIDSNGQIDITVNILNYNNIYTEGALSDFEGKSNTQGIIDGSFNMAPMDMHAYLIMFNQGTDILSYQKSEWYVPSLGQLGIIYLLKDEINDALVKIGGHVLSENIYWSSTEANTSLGWNMNMSNSFADTADKTFTTYVRFIHDIDGSFKLKERVLDLEYRTSVLENNKAELSNVYTKSEVDAKILELQTLINNYINGTSQVSELDT